MFHELKRRNVFRVCVAYTAAVWVLLQVADIIVPMFDGPDWLLRALFFAALLGFPMAVILAWFYELTPEGVKADTDLDVGETVPFTGRKIDFLIIGLLVMAVAFLLVDDVAAPEGSRSIAVLPFDNRSVGDEGAEFFAAGIHDDLIILLSKLSDVRVISRKSVERFAGTSQSLQEIADALGVTTVLEGGVRVAGNRVRINVQLIEPKTDTDLWAEIYDRELTTTNIFGIQSEVALNIVNHLQATLSPDERKRIAVVPTRNLEAYEEYVLGRQAMIPRTEPSLQAAIKHFQRAIELDKDFALAYVGLADVYAVQESWGYLSSEHVRPLIKAAATRALELDGQLGEAYVSLATALELEGDFAAAESAYKKAIELRPSYATAHSWYGLLLRWRLGRFEEAVQHAEQALLLDPLSPVLRMAYGDVLFGVGRFADAKAQYLKSIEIDPAFGGSYKMLGDLYLYTYGRTVEALQWYRDAVAVAPDPDWIGDIGGIYLVLGDTAEAVKWTEKARLTDPKNIFVNKHLAFLNYYQGHNELAEQFASKYLEGPLDIFVPYMLSILRNGYLQADRHADIRQMYEAFYPGLAADDAVVDRSNYRAAIDLALVLQKTGDPQRAQQLLTKSLRIIPDMPRLGLFGYGSAEAEIYALQGRPKEALSALRSAVEDGWRRHWFFWTELNSNMDAIRDAPEYRAMITSLEKTMATELASVRASTP